MMDLQTSDYGSLAHSRGVKTFSDLTESFAQNYRSYLAKGLSQERMSGLRFDWMDLVRPTYHFQIVEHGRSVGSIGLVTDSELGLPSDGAFRDELSDLRRSGMVLAEGTRLSGEQTAFDSHRAVMLLIAQMYRCAIDHDSQHLLVTVNPRHEQFWAKKLGFDVVASAPACPQVEGAEGVLLRKFLTDSPWDRSIREFMSFVGWKRGEIPSASQIASPLEMGLLLACDIESATKESLPQVRKVVGVSKQFEVLAPFLRQSLSSDFSNPIGLQSGPMVCAPRAADVFLHLLKFRARSQQKELTTLADPGYSSGHSSIALFSLLHACCYLNLFFDSLPSRSQVRAEIYSPSSLVSPTTVFTLSEVDSNADTTLSNRSTVKNCSLDVAFLHAQRVLALGGSIHLSQRRPQTIKITLPIDISS